MRYKKNKTQNVTKLDLKLMWCLTFRAVFATLWYEIKALLYYEIYNI
jgi:hypothetical protein